MESTPNPALLQLLLTYEELAFVLKLVKAATLPGLRPPQGEPCTAEQETQSLGYAERSLRARELARLTPEGQFVVHKALLSAVSVCAYADQALLVQHIKPDHTLVEFYGAHKDGAVVTQSQPEPGLYQLAVLQDAADLIAQALASSDCLSLMPASGAALTIGDDVLRQARQFAEQGMAAEAAALLAVDNDAASAAAVAAALAEPHALSILTVYDSQADSTARMRELTVLHTPQAAWLMTALPEQQARRLAPVTSAELGAMLQGYMQATVALVASA